jgi:hypothetical protein
MFTTVRVVHFGSASFERWRIKDIKNSGGINKPRGAYWCSPVDSKYGWEQWVNNNMDQWKTDIKHGATLDGHCLKIDSVTDYPGPLIADGYGHTTWDWEWLADNYGFVWLTKAGLDACHDELYGWDCESIAVLNGGCVTSDDDLGDPPVDWDAIEAYCNELNNQKEV